MEVIRLFTARLSEQIKFENDISKLEATIYDQIEEMSGFIEQIMKLKVELETIESDHNQNQGNKAEEEKYFKIFNEFIDGQNQGQVNLNNVIANISNIEDQHNLINCDKTNIDFEVNPEIMKRLEDIKRNLGNLENLKLACEEKLK